MDRALSFGGAAEDYDRYRPAPPAEAVAWVLPPGARDVVELGAGTGGLSRRVLAAGVTRHVAVEPDARMRRVLVRRTPGVLAVGAWAEAVPVRRRCADAVLASSSWHWMDPDRTLAEVARILRPGGRLGLLWNGPDRRDPQVARLLGPRTDSEWRRRIIEGLPAVGRLGKVEYGDFSWEETLSPDEVVGLAGTYSVMLTLSDGEQQAAAEHVRRQVGPDPVTLPMRCFAVRARLTAR